MKYKIGFSLKELLLIIVITAITTSLTTGVIMYNNNKLSNGAVDINKDEPLKEFLKVYASLGDNYYEDIDKTAMIDSAIKGMLDYLGEDYSTYLDQSETSVLNNQLKGTYEGIGISIINNNQIHKVYDDTPASKVGLAVGDIILSVNGTNALDETPITSLIKKNEENTLIIQRGEEQLTIKVTPETINTPLTREVKEYNGKRIGYVYLPSFNNTAATEFRKSIEELESENIESLIIDLRYNSGGYLSATTDIASMFLEKGQKIYSLETKEKVESFYDDTKEQRNYKIVVLINEASASASEVLSAALKESYGATLVGGVSYGKGKVQTTKSLDDGSMVKYTTAKWYTPTGECIDGFGIYPDYSIELPDPDDENFVDTQLNKALEILGN